jgi:hypothetical protein
MTYAHGRTKRSIFQPILIVLFALPSDMSRKISIVKNNFRLAFEIFVGHALRDMLLAIQ